MKRNISVLAFLFCLCFSISFSLKGQNYSDPDPEINQLKENLARGRMNNMEIKNFRNKLKSGNNFNEDIGNPPAWSWVRTFGGSGGIVVNDVALDGSGNFYILATFSDSIKILTHTFVSQGMRDVIVLKISNLGTYLWGSQLKSSVEQNIYGKSLALGTGGKVYITGDLASVTITGGSISRTKEIDEEQIFSAGLDNAGNFEWLKFDTQPEAIRIHTDNKGDVYWMTSSSLYKLNPGGDTIWSKEVGGHLNDFKISGEKIWLSGIVEGAGTIIADIPFTPTITDYAVFLVEMDTTSLYLQRKFMETSYGYDPYYTAAFLELDSKGNIYISGMVYDFNIDGSWIENPSMAYVYKLNKNLDLVWALNEDSWNIEIYGFSKSSDSRFYEYGMYWISKKLDSLTIGNITVFPESDRKYGYYLAEIDSSGNVLRIKTFSEDSKNFIVKSPDLLYRAYTDLYDVAVEKVTLEELKYWEFKIENTGGSASFRYTMDIDEDGNLYAQGYYRGQIRIINETLKGSGIIFVKFDNDGKLKWWRNMENPDGISSGIRVDKNGNVYAWGTFNDYIKISNQKYYSESGSDIYFVKFDKDGDLKFVKQFEGNNTVVGTGAIDVDQEGNIIIAGTFSDTLKLGSYELISYKQSYDIFLSKFDPDGGVIWARSYKGKSIEYARSLAVDGQNNIYFTGYYRDSIAFDSILILRNYGGYDMYITKLDPKGNVIWVETGGPYNRFVRGNSIVVKNSNLFVLDYSISGTGPFYFDSGNISFMSEFSNNFFLARYDLDGNYKWTKLIKANNYCNPMSRIDMDESDNVYIGGVFADTLVIEGNLVAGSSGYSYFIAKYDTIGNLKWVKTSDQSNTGDFQLYSLKTFKEDIVLVAGTVFDGIAQVGNYRIVTAGTSSFAGLIGKAIISCVMDLDLTITNSQPGDSTGWAKVSITGGTQPYYIVWSNGQKDTDSIYDQPAGWYQVNVVDTLGCMQYKTLAINDLNGLEVNVDSIHNVSCFGGNDGFININVNGGTSPYRYYWSNGMESQNLKSLVAAPYELMVIDFNGLVNYQSFNVSEPKPLDISYNLYPASCGGGTDGRIDLFVSGGTGPYEYEWNTGWLTDSLYGVQAGKYKVEITDYKGCIMTLEIPLSEKGSFIVETDSVINETCNMNDGQATIKVLNSVGDLSYTWTTGATTKNLSGVKAGTYFVYVVNEAGCKTVHKVDVGSILPSENPICLVTVDTATGSNLVVWEKVANAEIYYVFRETTAQDRYVLAGSVSGGALSVFTDSIADPTIRSYRYKIAAVDNCDNASILSMIHKTVHLRINQGIFGEINLAWDDYVGEYYESFEVWRYSSLFGWELLETLPANLFSYTDFSVPPGLVYYNVRVPFPNMCYPSGYSKADSGPYSHSMSNIEDNRFQTGSNEIKINPGFYIYPNPTESKCIIWSETIKLENAEIQVLDLQGRVILDEKYVDNSEGKIYIDLTGQSEGSYIVKIISEGLIMFSKLIIL